MQDRVRSGRRRLLRRDDESPANEDFLFHLSRGSEMLMSDRVVEAKEELERALEHRPRDAQSQDLLAGVYFRLGLYPTAIRIWQGLVADFPDDTVLHVNLGLALFKTGQPIAAQDSLMRALELESDHERAWGYLGLVRWRLGKLDLAREAFLRGGQLTMARRMEEQSSAGTIPAPPPAAVESPEALPSGIEDAEVRAMRDAAGAAAEKLADDAHLALEEDRPRKRSSGQWNIVETGGMPLPVGAAGPAPAVQAPTPRSVQSISRSWALKLPQDSPLAIGPAGELLLNSEHAVHARLSGLRAVRGPLDTEAVLRRFRGRSSEEPLGGHHDPIRRWAGPVAAVIACAPERQFVAMHVDETQLYVREELVHSFDHSVGYESGRLPLAGRPAVLLSFHGSGVVVLSLPRLPSGLGVETGDEVFVAADALVGWTGRLFPSESDDSETSVPLAFKGQGTLLIT